MPRQRKPASQKQGHTKPTELRVIPGGAARKRQPAAPKGLLAPTRSKWTEFWKSDVAQAVDDVDLPRLRRWILNVDEYERLQKVIRKAPTVKGSQGQPVLNPLTKRVETLEVAIERAEREFGMTPKARVNLGIATGNAAMTAEKLNRMIEEGSGSDEEAQEAGQGEVIEGVNFKEA